MTLQELEIVRSAFQDEMQKIAAVSVRSGRIGISPANLAKFKGSLGKFKKIGSAKPHLLDRTIGPLALMGGGAAAYHYGRKYHQDRNMGRQMRLQSQQQW